MAITRPPTDRCPREPVARATSSSRIEDAVFVTVHCRPAGGIIERLWMRGMDKATHARRSNDRETKTRGRADSMGKSPAASQIRAMLPWQRDTAAAVVPVIWTLRFPLFRTNPPGGRSIESIDNGCGRNKLCRHNLSSGVSRTKPLFVVINIRRSQNAMRNAGLSILLCS